MPENTTDVLSPRRQSLQRLLMQIFANLNVPSILDIIRNGRVKEVIQRIKTSMVGYSLEEEESLGSPIMFEGETVGFIQEITIRKMTMNLVPQGYWLDSDTVRKAAVI